jgi:hypothetical protein
MACKNCGNTKCNKLDCGCKDKYLTTPPPCPTPEDCPEAQPCSYITDAQCVAYNGEDILCNGEVVVEEGDRLDVVIAKIIDYYCHCIELDLSCLTGSFTPEPGEPGQPSQVQNCLTPREAFTLVNEAICDINDLLSGFEFDWFCLKYAPYVTTVNYGPFTLAEAFEHLNTVVCDLYNNLSGRITTAQNGVNQIQETLTSYFIISQPQLFNLPIYPDDGTIGLWSNQGLTNTITYNFTSSPEYTIPAGAAYPGKYEVSVNATGVFYTNSTAAALTIGVNGTSVGQFTLVAGTPVGGNTGYLPMHLTAVVQVTNGDVISVGVSATVPNDPAQFKIFGGQVKIQRIGN